MVGGLWSVVCGLWSVVCGLWSVVCGLWSVVCGTDSFDKPRRVFISPAQPRRVEGRMIERRKVSASGSVGGVGRGGWLPSEEVDPT